MKWKYLKPDAIIDIIAPSFAKGRKENIYLQNACKAIKDLGFTPRYSPNLIDRKKSTFCANSDEFRYNDFKKALYAKDSQAIWAYRGGYGANKILPLLINDEKPSIIKPLIGFSDITFLLNFLYTKWKIPSIHGPVLSQFTTLPFENFEAVKNLLNGTNKKIEYELFPQNIAALNIQTISSILIGGNAMLMQNSLATEWQINTDNKIVFMEEVGERGYALDRVLEHLFHAKFFNKVKAIIFGDIIGKKEKNGKDMCINAIQDFTDKINIPVFKIKNIGHGSSNFPLPIGANAMIHLKNNKAYITVESGGE